MLVGYSVLTWLEVQDEIRKGATAVLVDGGHFWHVYLPENMAMCDLMKSDAFDLYPANVTRFMSKAVSLDFEQNWLPKLRAEAPKGTDSHA